MCSWGAKNYANDSREPRRKRVLRQDAVEKWTAAKTRVGQLSKSNSADTRRRRIEEETQLRQALLDALNSPSAAGARDERLVEGVEQFSVRLERAEAVLTTFDRFNSGAGVPDWQPGQTASQRLAGVYQEIRRLQT